MAWSRRRFIVSGSLTAGAAALVPILSTRKSNVKRPLDRTPDWSVIRAQFDLAPEYVHAALFFLASNPRPVREAIDDLRRKIDANPFLTVEHGAFGVPEENLQARAVASIARYIGADPQDVALTSNTTAGLALVYHGLSLEAGDEIVATEHDHYVHHESIRLAAERSGATWRKVALFPPHDASKTSVEEIISKLRGAISPKTRVLGLTWVHSSSGVKLPLREIAAAMREVNANRSENDRVLIVVDGVHGLGVEDPRVAALGIDVFASGLHKWILAPRGTGFVWARPEVWGRMRPLIPTFSSFELYEAWMSGKKAAGPVRGGWIAPGGFHAFDHVWAIPAAIQFHESIEPKRVTHRIHELNGAARRELATMKHVSLRTPMSRDLSAGIVAFEVAGMTAEAVVTKLLEKKIIASTSPYGITYARISFGLANSTADVEKTVAAIRGLG